MGFNINVFKTIEADNYRYQRQITRLQKCGFDTEKIEEAVDNSINQIKKAVRAFVIFGEPQSGKTEMMICLTAKLLDEGKQIIIHLLNDNNTLLKQNLERFKESGIDPDPKDFNYVLDSHIEIGDKKWIIFCKKNSINLKKLLVKLESIKGKVIIDDEADYATPNSKVNQGEKTKIHELIGRLYDDDGIYIGVTATPARLDLNNTYDNANDSWVYFKPHHQYTGQDIFFPINLETVLKYKLKLIENGTDEKQQIQNAIFSFLISVAHRNTHLENNGTNYSMLIHTSRKKVDHDSNYRCVLDIMNILSDQKNINYESYLRKIWDTAKNRCKSEDSANKILQYILTNISRNTVTVMNSDKKSPISGWDSATNPKVPFSIVIGGDIVSRGVTFKRLLLMFFTRNVKGKMHQDTYIQRARMFGTRNDYLSDFELWIPEDLFTDWHKCFVLHRLALGSIISDNGSPVWLETKRIGAVSSQSIDHTTVSIDNSEMGFDIFSYSDDVEKIIRSAYSGKISMMDALITLNRLNCKNLPDYIIEFVKQFMPDNDLSVAIHKSAITTWKDVNQDKIERAKGFIGTGELELSKFPQAIHHFKIILNNKKQARIYYKFVGSIRFLKNLK